MKHHTKDKGDLAVLKAQVDLHLKGYIVFTSQSEHQPFDLIAYKEGKFLRIQIKHRKIGNRGIIKVSFSTSWADKNGTHKSFYDKKEIDLFCIYCPDTDKCYYVNPQDFNTDMCLRFIATVNKHTKIAIHVASDFEQIKI